MDKETLYALGILLMFLVYLAEKLIANRQITTLTAALTAAKSDPALIEAGHKLAIEVVPAALLTQAMSALNAIAPLIKQTTSPEIDAAIDAATGLAGDIVNDTPETTATSVALSIPPGTIG